MHTLRHTHSFLGVTSDKTAPIFVSTRLYSGRLQQAETSNTALKAEHAQRSLGVCACLEVSANDVSDVRVAHFDSHHTPHPFNRHDSFVHLQRRP